MLINPSAETSAKVRATAATGMTTVILASYRPAVLDHAEGAPTEISASCIMSGIAADSDRFRRSAMDPPTKLSSAEMLLASAKRNLNVTEPMALNGLAEPVTRITSSRLMTVRGIASSSRSSGVLALRRVILGPSKSTSALSPRGFRGAGQVTLAQPRDRLPLMC